MTIQIVSSIMRSATAMMRITWMGRMMTMMMIKCTCRFILISSLRRTKWAWIWIASRYTSCKSTLSKRKSTWMALKRVRPN